MNRYRTVQIHVALRLLMSLPDIKLLSETPGGKVFIQVMFQNRNFSEVAKAHKLSAERCRQLFRRTLNKISRLIHDKHEQWIRMDAATKEYKNKIDAKEKQRQHILQLSLSALNLPPRIRGVFKSRKIDTIQELLAVPRKELLECKNFGARSMIQLNTELKKWNIVYGGKII